MSGSRGYISEIVYYGKTKTEFVEIALPEGTDPSAYKVSIYGGDGRVDKVFNLGEPVKTMAGHDVYVLDSDTCGWDWSWHYTGNFGPRSAVALTEGDDTLQFLSWGGNTVHARNGPACWQSSDSVGWAGYGNSLQSDDGGQSYYVQCYENPGEIPACYGPGTLIDTPTGPRKVETLCPGDQVLNTDGHAVEILWVWRDEQPLDQTEAEKRPVLIAKGTLGHNVPAADLVVSPQHRIAVGLPNQLSVLAPEPAFVPAKALTNLPGIRFMNGKRHIVWYHMVCADHQIIMANGTTSETMLIGTEVLKGLGQRDRASLESALGGVITQTPALPCLRVKPIRKTVQRLKKAA